MTKILLSIVTTLAILSKASATESDPYKSIKIIKLENGLQVFLAPSEETSLTSIKVEVDVGWEIEAGSDIGVSHLLEHVLFRDKQLKEEMSYLQLIQEAGGSANGSTTQRETNYFGTIPHDKSNWMLHNFYRMLMEPQITEEYVTKEKSTIELERGRPNPIFLSLGFNPFEYLMPDYLGSTDFWESEFGLVDSETYSRTEEQLSTRKLTAAQIKKHYKDYYYPANMRLFVAGKFDEAAIMKDISETWGKIPASEGKKLPNEKRPINRDHSYIRYNVASGNPDIKIGAKVFDVSLAEEVVIDSYLHYMAHRLMKEVRNKKGQTYSARANLVLRQGSGYAAIDFSTPQEHFSENLTLVEKYFSDEAAAGGLSAEQIQEAVKLKLADHKLAGREAETMMRFASYYSQMLRERNLKTSPYELLSSTTPAFYNATLKKYFTKGLTYKYLRKPNIFFYMDDTLFCILSALCSFYLFRRLLTKKFENDKIRWVRKLVYPSLKIIEIGLMAAAAFIYMHIYRMLEYAFLNFELLNSNFFVNEYIGSVLVIFAAVACAQIMLSISPRKLMVVGSNITVKSVSYYSFNIPLAEIKSVKTVRHLSFHLLKVLPRLKHRFFATSPKFWQKGILIERTDGRMYFFSVTNADAAKKELEGFISPDTGVSTQEAA